MSDLKRCIRALSNPSQHAIALLRTAQTFRNWGPLVTNYGWHGKTMPLCEAVFRRDNATLPLAGRADLSNLWAIFGREEYPVFATDERIIDIGANIGLFSIFAARRAPLAHVTAIEPVKSTFKTLADNVRLSGIGDRISLINTAVASTERQQRIYLGSSSDLASLYPSSLGQDTEWIDTKSINTILRDLEGPVSLLKMDCEGAEWEILESAEPEYFLKVRRLYVEYHGLTHEKMRTALGQLTRLGFQADRTQHHGSGQTAVVWASRTNARNQ